MNTIDQIQNFVLTFSSVLWEALPFIVLGALVAGILEELLPQQLITKYMPKSALPAVLLGGVLGLVFPMCECGIVVVMRRLLRKGVPLSCCIAYMLAGPILNPVVLLSTWVAFDLHGIAGTMVGFRAGLGFVVAVITALIVHAIQKRSSESLLTKLATPPGARALPMAEDNENGNSERKPWTKRISNISETALHDFIDITVFLIIGSVLAAIIKLYVGQQMITELSHEQPFLSIPIMMLMAVVMCLCSEADAFVAASFTGMTVSSKLAFLVLGPMLDIKLVLMFTRVFKPRLIFVIIICTTIQVFTYTSMVHFLPSIDAKKTSAPAISTSTETTPAPTSPSK